MATIQGKLPAKPTNRNTWAASEQESTTQRLPTRCAPAKKISGNRTSLDLADSVCRKSIVLKGKAPRGRKRCPGVDRSLFLVKMTLVPPLIYRELGRTHRLETWRSMDSYPPALGSPMHTPCIQSPSLVTPSALAFLHFCACKCALSVLRTLCCYFASLTNGQIQQQIHFRPVSTNQSLSQTQRFRTPGTTPPSQCG